jgi:hypothetical protein
MAVSGPIVVASNILLFTPVGYGAYTRDVAHYQIRKAVF